MEPVAFLIAVLMGAVPEACLASWADDSTPSVAETQKCATAWLEVTYGPRFTVDDLTLDVPLGTRELHRLTRVQLQRMAKHVKKTCKICEVARCADDDRTCYIAGRAIELFEGEANLRVSIYDPSRMRSIGPLLWTVLAGKRLSAKDITPKDGVPWTPLTLWKLRNAVFARHGRRFSHPDLRQLFYGPHRKNSKWPKLAVDPAYQDDRLTAIDRANIQQIRRAESRRPALKSNE